MLTSGVPRYSVLGDGSVFMPAQQFSQESNTGIYREINTSTTGATSSAWAVSKLGTKRLRVTDTGGDLYGVWNTGTSSAATTFVAGDGTAPAPAYTFASDTKTGIYKPGGNRVGVTIAGTEVVDFSSTATDFKNGVLRAGDGSVTTPSYSYGSETNLGIYKPSAGAMAFASGNLNIFSADQTRFITTVPMQLPITSASTPSYSFNGDSTSGLFSAAAGSVRIGASGVTKVAVSTTEVGTTVPIFTPDGSASAPAYTFTSDNDTGVYRISAGAIGVTGNGTLMMGIAPGVVTLQGSTLTDVVQILNGSGSAVSPSYTFTVDSGLGLYRFGPGKLAQASGGTTVWSADTNGFSSSVPIIAPNGTAAVPGLRFSGAGPPGVYYDNVDTMKFEVVPSTPVFNISTLGPVVTSRADQWLTPSLPSTKTALTWASGSTSSLTPCLTYAQDTTNGDTWTVVTEGVYGISGFLSMSGGGGNPQAYITRNGSGTFAFASITSTTGLCSSTIAQTYIDYNMSPTRLLVGDVIRTHISTSSGAASIVTASACFLRITFIYATATSL